MRGGDFEYPDQPAPHPAHLTDGAEQDIYLVDFKGSPPIKHANGHAPLVSPAGDRVVFLRKGEIWTIALRPGAKAMQLFKTRGDLASKDVVAALTTDAPADVLATALGASPISSVSTWRSPVLMIHGDDDRNVAFSETVRLAEVLRKQGVDYAELVFPDEIHDFLRHETWLRAYKATADFLDQKLAR
jgi:acetyl esterase/lipase